MIQYFDNELLYSALMIVVLIDDSAGLLDLKGTSFHISYHMIPEERRGKEFILFYFYFYLEMTASLSFLIYTVLEMSPMFWVKF